MGEVEVVGVWGEGRIRHVGVGVICSAGAHA